jgi:hypothetical protein
MGCSPIDGLELVRVVGAVDGVALLVMVAMGGMCLLDCGEVCRSMLFAVWP